MKKKTIILLILLCIGIIPKMVLAETYDGEYSIEYLLRNYNAVTLGNNTENGYDFMDYFQVEKGMVYGFRSIEGAILINGDYLLQDGDRGSFGTQAGTTKSFIKGENPSGATTSSELVTDSNYIDFDKLYTAVLAQSKALAANSQYSINSSKTEISKPGIYTIKNLAIMGKYKDNQGYNRGKNNRILIKNYDRDAIYVFNYYNEYVPSLPDILIMEEGSSNALSLKDFAESGKYTGNIIWNFPNAKTVRIKSFDWEDEANAGVSGHIIAPEATITLYNNYGKYNEEDANEYYMGNFSYYRTCTYYGTIVANSIINYDTALVFDMKKTSYSLSKPIINEAINYDEKPNDYPDDIYSRDYSIRDLLQNYSLVTTGHKEIDSKSSLSQLGYTPGSIRLFHITGPVLIAGDLFSKVYEGELDEFYANYSNVPKHDRTNFDLESNEVTESYIRGSATKTFANKVALSVIQPWNNMANDNVDYLGKKNLLLVGYSNSYNYRDNIGSGFVGEYSFYSGGNFNGIVDNYLNFDRLYDNIVAEQKGIEEGKKVTEEDVTHIKIGGNYVIDNINDINEIVFDNFQDEKDKVTIITIKNIGDINFPLISKDTGSYKGIVTNDYYGKEQATHLYEADTFITEDSYHGNIIWNVPNATYIKLKENAPFAGHLIAPNADVETPETHFAGCFIVNSIYGEGNTEAHFYPITAEPKCDCEEYDELSPILKMKYSQHKLGKLLGSDKSTIEKEIMGDKAQYRENIETFEVIESKCDEETSLGTGNPIVDIITNPLTLNNSLIILGTLSIVGLGLYKLKNSKRRKGD